MKKFMKPSKKAALIVLVFMISACGLQKVENYNSTKSASPKGDFEVVWYNRDAGATTSVATAMLIIHKGSEPNYDDPALVINEQLAVKPIVEWVTDSSVKVRLDKAKIHHDATFIKKLSQDGVSIEYVPMKNN